MTRDWTRWANGRLDARVTRRQVLTGLGALGAAAAFRQLPLAGQTPAPPFRIDIHQHFVSPAVLAEVTKRNVGNANMRRWTPALAIEELDKSSAAAAVLSLT